MKVRRFNRSVRRAADMLHHQTFLETWKIYVASVRPVILTDHWHAARQMFGEQSYYISVFPLRSSCQEPDHDATEPRTCGTIAAASPSCHGLIYLARPVLLTNDEDSSD